MDTAATKVLGIVAIMFVAVLLFGCATNSPFSPEAGTRIYCNSYEPVRWSSKDTDETIAQTKANNAVFNELCK